MLTIDHPASVSTVSKVVNLLPFGFIVTLNAIIRIFITFGFVSTIEVVVLVTAQALRL